MKGINEIFSSKNELKLPILNMVRLCIAITVLIAQLATAENAANIQKLLVDDTAHEISTCDLEGCSPLQLSDPFLDQWKEGSVTLADITLNGRLDVILTAHGDVNVCSTAYAYDDLSRVLIAIDVSPLCNYRLESNYLISSYRSGAKWFEDIYKINNGKFLLYVKDGCLDCDYVYRTLYDQEQGKNLLVSNATDFQNRSPKKAKVVSKKTVLYTFPSNESATEGYLIKGDEVSLINYVDAESGAWFLVRYVNSGGRAVERWMREESLQVL
jgi:hypothetical protein